MQIDYLDSSGDNNTSHAWTLRARMVTTLGFPVPTFQPKTNNVAIGVDITPVGPSPIENAGNGWAWLDCCNVDLMNNPTAPVACARLGIKTINGAPAAYVGNIPFNGQNAGNLWFVTGDGTLVSWGITYKGDLLPFTDNAFYIGGPVNRAIAIYAANGTIQTSDAGEKTDLKPTKLGLGFINSLSPVSYRWKSGEDHALHQGLTAQNVLAAAGGEPCGVQEGEKLGLNYAELIGPLIRAVQELSAEVERLKKI